MSTTIHALVHSLREELKQYGEMLALLEEQQECIVARRIEDLLRSAVSIQSQGDGLQETRQNRARLQAQLAAELGLPEGEPRLAQLLGRVPEAFRPLLEALVEENSALLQRVQQRARQNHLLLSRSMDLMQAFIQSLVHPGDPALYSGQGGRAARGTPAAAFFEAVG